MLTAITNLFNPIKRVQTFLYLGAGILVLTLALGGLHYVRTKASEQVKVEEERRQTEVQEQVKKILAEQGLDDITRELNSLRDQIKEEQAARTQLTTDLLQLRSATDQAVARIRRRQQDLERGIRQNPEQTAQQLSNEYNELNQRLKAIAERYEPAP